MSFLFVILQGFIFLILFATHDLFKLFSHLKENTSLDYKDHLVNDV
jgi:hypothetical protein